MDIDFTEINYLQDPHCQDLHADYEQFLLSMTGPTVIDITGINTDKCRVIVTLLHGNEPSGLIAIHRWLISSKRKNLPQTNLRFIICSVEAASKSPLFARRFIEGNKDINRCFGHNSQKIEGIYLRAHLIDKAIREVNPEMVIDLHNAATPSPSFAVSYKITTETLSLASFFCQTLLLSDLQLHSLMEQDFSCPFITIECGGCLDEQAHEMAYAGISQLAKSVNIDYIHQEKKVEIIYRPLRLRLKNNVNLSYAEHDEGHSGVTLKNNIEYLNFGGAQQDEMIGWTDGDGIKNLQIIDKEGNNVIDDYFYCRDNQLVCRHKLRVFKATTNRHTASSDCLFYVVKQA